MKDYYTKTRKLKMWAMQIDYILENREIPTKLLRNLGLDEKEGEQ
jgi:hypothetical protein